MIFFRGYMWAWKKCSGGFLKSGWLRFQNPIAPTSWRWYSRRKRAGRREREKEKKEGRTEGQTDVGQVGRQKEKRQSKNDFLFWGRIPTPVPGQEELFVSRNFYFLKERMGAR